MGYVHLLISSINPFITSNASLYFQMPLPCTAFSSKKEMPPPPTLLPRLTLYSALVSSKYYLYFHFLFLHIISILCLSSYPEFTPPSKKKKNPWTHDFHNDPEFHHFFLLPSWSSTMFSIPRTWWLASFSKFLNVYSIWQCWLLLPSESSLTSYHNFMCYSPGIGCRKVLSKMT